MNPYQTPPSRDVEPRQRRGKFEIIVIVGLVLGAITVAMPGLAFLSSDWLRPVPPGRRYATYDREFFIFGFEVSETTATWLALAIAPGMIVLASILLFRHRFRRTINPNSPQA